jgi:sulfite reductase (NADPH) flavoprotein alpha-component
MDGTIAYQKVEHHINSEVDAMLGMYELGVLKTPDFGQAWGVALSDKGLQFITLRDAFYAWVDVLYMIVEIENAVLNDFRIRYEPFTDIETDDCVVLSASKVQQLGLAHERLVTNYLDHVLGKPMETLWAMTIGLLKYENLDAGWMRGRLDEIQAEPASQAVIHLAQMLRERIKQDDERLTASAEVLEAQYGAFCDFLADEDCRLIDDLKLAIRDGVMVFEANEQHTITRSGDRLLKIMYRIPTILEQFYSRLSHTLDL